MDKKDILDEMAKILRKNGYTVSKHKKHILKVTEDSSIHELRKYMKLKYNGSGKGIYSLAMELDTVGSLVEKLETDRNWLVKRRGIGKKTHQRVVDSLKDHNLYNG